MRLLHSVCLLAAAAMFAAVAAAAQDYPTRPIRMLIPFAPGGPSDVIGRILAAKFTEAFGQQVVVDNRPGAGGNIAIGMAARAPADGYTILVVSSSFVVNPGLYAKIPYDPFKDFAPVSNVAVSPNVLYVHPSLPAKSVKELADLIKAQPGKYSIATAGIGTTPHLSAELFKLTLGLDLANVPFAGAAPAMQSTLANQTPMAFTALPPTIPHIKAGTLRALAVTAARRSPELPDVPTMAEAGIPGQEAYTLQGALVPAGTPQAIVDRLHAEIVKAVGQPEVRERIAAQGFDIVAGTPQQFAAQIREEVAKWSKVIKAARIRVE